MLESPSRLSGVRVGLHGRMVRLRVSLKGTTLGTQSKLSVRDPKCEKRRPR